MFKKKPDTQALYVAVEVAVMIRECLHKDDDLLPRYEYIGEARQIVAYALENIKMEPHDLAKEIGNILTKALEHPYNEHLDDFLEVAEFILKRVEHYYEYSII